MSEQDETLKATLQQVAVETAEQVVSRCLDSLVLRFDDGERCIDAGDEAIKIVKLYHELLYAVGMKWPGETRRQTALRYIRQAEEPKGGTAQQNTHLSGGVPAERKP